MSHKMRYTSLAFLLVIVMAFGSSGLINPKTHAQDDWQPMSYAPGCEAGGSIASIEAIDHLTVKFTLCASDPAFPFDWPTLTPIEGTEHPEVIRTVIAPTTTPNATPTQDRRAQQSWIGGTRTPRATVTVEAPTATPTATTEVVETPTPEATPRLVARVIVPNNVYVRPSPSTQGSPLATLPPNSEVSVLGRNESGQAVNGNSVWYQVELPNGRSGWVWGGAVEIAQAPSVSAPPATQESSSTIVEVQSDRNPENDGFVTLDELAQFPSTIRYTFEGYSPDGVNPGRRTRILLELDMERLSFLRDRNGRPLPFGIYTERPPIDDELFVASEFLGGAEVHAGYVVGILSHIEVNPNFGNVMLGISVPIEATGQFATVNISLNHNSQRLGVVNETGRRVRSDQFLKLGNDVAVPGHPEYSGVAEGTGVYFSGNEQYFSYPTPQGMGVLRPGDPIAARFILNDSDVESASNQIVGSGRRTAPEVIEALMDETPTNDGRVVWSSMGFVLPYVPQDTTR